MRPGIIMLAFFLLSSTAEARAGLSLNLDGVEELALREAIQSSFNFPTSGSVPADQGHDLDRETRRLTALMHALGYLDAYTEAGHVKLQLAPIPGKIFKLGYVAVEGLSDSSSIVLQAKLRHRMDKYLGSPARSDSLSDIRRDVLQVFKENGYPAPGITSVELRKHSLTRLIGVHLAVDAGVRASFGDVIFTEEPALDIVDDAELAGLTYHPAAIDKLRATLEEADKFSRISLSTQLRTDDPAIVDIEADLQRKAKTQEQLASHGLAGFITLLAACALIVFRQLQITGIRGPRHGSPIVMNTLLGVVLVTGAAFAVERVLFLIG